MPDRQPGDPEHLMLVTAEERTFLESLRRLRAALPAAGTMVTVTRNPTMEA